MKDVVEELKQKLLEAELEKRALKEKTYKLEKELEEQKRKANRRIYKEK